MNNYQIIVLLILILVLLYVKRNVSKKRNRQIQQQGLLNIKSIKHIIHLIQQHRGMTAAYINGEKNVLNRINIIRGHIKDSINNSDIKLNKNNERWQNFVDHWQRLGIGKIHTSAENSFAQHTKLIGNLLYLVEDEAEKGLLFSQFLPQFPQAGYVWREVLCSTELIGQARAIGVGVATQASCSSIDNIRLSFLQQQISEVIGTVLNELYCLPQYVEQHNQLIKTAQHQTEKLVKTIEQKLLSSKKITLDQTAYFEQATLVIKSIDDVFEHQLTQISDSLDVIAK